MAIFNRKQDVEKKDEKATGDAKAAVAVQKKDDKKPAKKEEKVKEKKAAKPTSDAGANLTKAPVRILLSPRITEKAAYMTMQNGYVFEVAMDATKRDVVAAVKALYKVTPVKVNIVVKRPRAYVARFRNRRGTKSGMKKAYVFLKKGEKIDLM
jgi:large subunit ribosomal protein L23